MSAQRPSLSRRQLGVSLILFAITLMTVVGGAFFLLNTNDSDPKLKIATDSSRSLSQAKSALITFALAYPLDEVIARLPFPDRAINDGDLDGESDCVTGPLSTDLLMGRFPWRKEAVPCIEVEINANLRDGAGQRLWYAVAPYMLKHASNLNFNPNYLDPAFNQWIRVYNQNGLVSDRVAFVVMAPGEALTGQNHNNLGAGNYLESFTVPGFGTIDNAVPDSQFVMAPADDNFNDQLLFVTIEQLMPMFETRVLKEFQNIIKQHKSVYNVYPYPADLMASPTFNCNITLATGGGFLSNQNTGPMGTQCLATNPNLDLSAMPYLDDWLPYVIYEARPDCLDPLNNPGCDNQPGGLTVDGQDGYDFVLLSTGYYPLPGSNNRNTYLEDAINQDASDQTYVTPSPTLSNDQIIFQ